MRITLSFIYLFKKSLLFFITFFVLIFAQDNRLRLKQADLLENITIDGISMQYLKGDVVFSKGDMIITCDWARFNQSTEQGFLFGKVSMNENEQNLTCDSMFVDSPKDIMIAYGNANVWDTTYSLVADTLFYFSELDSGSANGQATLIQKKQVIKGNRIEYKDIPEVDGVSYAARGNVTITEEGRIATCGEAIYDREKSNTILRINPEIIDNDQTIAGSEIYLNYNDELLESLFIPSNAHATHPSKGIRERLEIIEQDTTIYQDPLEFTDDMTGSIMKGYFVDGKLDSIRLEGMATTIYHIFEDSIYQGKNQSSGDTITMNFGENDIEKIFISGGSEGTYTPDSTGADMDGPVIYKSEDIEYDVTNEFTDLHGDATIDYTNVNLSAGFINIAWRNNLLIATPESERDSSYGIIRPSMVEDNEEPMVGDTMIYNLETRNGKVIKGTTKAEDGFYHGQEIRNQNMDIFYAKHAAYTTCDLEDPHFHFEMNRMKMINEDKVVARPIILYIANIPIFGLPFGVFPHQKGRRHSGWIMPTYGTDARWGGYINGLGFYWAPSDYYDSKFTMSLYDRDGITLRSQNQYSKRYKYSGSFDLETKQRFSSSVPDEDRDIYNLGSNRQSDYVVRWNHRQKLRNNQSAAVNASYYSSGDYNRRTGIEQQKRLNQQAVSNATYSKRWPKSRNSLSINLSSRRDLMAEKKIDQNSVFYNNPTRAGQQINITNNTVPQMAFSHSQRALFPTKAKKKNWYNNINYNYSSRFTNNLKNYYESESYSIDDSTNGYRWLIDKNDDPLANTFSDYIIAHTTGLNMSSKIFKYFNISPSLSLKSDWVNRTFSGDLDTLGKINKNEIKGFATRTTGSFNVNMNTQIYGLLPLKIGKIQAIRHVISPSLGYSFRPDFSKEVFGMNPGYYEEIKQDNGESVYFDRFSGTLAGGTPKGENQSMNISVNNVFQAKIINGDKEIKQDLFSWRMSTSRNFVADEFQWNNLNSSVRANINRKLNLDFSMTHDWYEFDKKNNLRINKIKTTGGLLTPRLINARFSTGFRFSGNRLSYNSEDEQVEEPDSSSSFQRVDGANLAGSITGLGNNKSAGKLWDTSMSFSFAYNNANPNNPQKTFWMSSNSTIQLTEAWRVQYNARFDLINQNLVSHTFSINRDLHCWELSLNWTPNGYASGLYLRLNVKSPNLRDLKLEQRGGTFNRPSLFDR
tara:strand:+ start:1335 stop:4934 length:3600 start_codon:yes stop_codon:yes gene_type:complete